MDIIADYCIAEHNVRVVFAENGKNNTELLPSFEPFKKEGSNDDFLFTLRVDDTLPWIRTAASASTRSRRATATP